MAKSTQKEQESFEEWRFSSEPPLSSGSLSNSFYLVKQGQVLPLRMTDDGVNDVVLQSTEKNEVQQETDEVKPAIFEETKQEKNSASTSDMAMNIDQILSRHVQLCSYNHDQHASRSLINKGDFILFKMPSENTKLNKFTGEG